MTRAGTRGEALLAALFAAVLLVLILIFEAISKALKPWALLSLLAFILAAATSFAWKIGLPPLN